MKRLPHWYKAALGMRVGLAKFAFVDGGFPVETTEIERDRAVTTHAKFIIGLTALEDFSTRDYAYDRGGQSMSDTEMNDYVFSEWNRRTS